MIQSSDKRVQLLVVIVNYHGSDMVAKLLEQIDNQNLPAWANMSIVCADNSVSSREQQALEQITQDYPMTVSLLFNKTNTGYGKAINEAAKGQDFDYLCCLNPDVKLQPNAIKALLDYAVQHQKHGIWGLVTIDEHQQLDFRHAWPEPTLTNTLAWATGLSRFWRRPSLQDDYRYRYADSPNQMQKPYPADSVSGCCMLVSSQAWSSLGGFDELFFLYSEEIDLCRRARLAGFQPTVVPESRLEHRKHSFDETSKRLRIVYRAKFLYVQKHYRFLYAMAYRISICLGGAARILHALFSSKKQRAQAWFRVVQDGLFWYSDTQLDRSQKNVE